MNTQSFAIRFLTTLLVAAIAAVVAWQLWVYYMDDPWTRDGTVRADVVEVAPDVSGLVTDVFVHDNQAVHAGDPLFQIDPVRFTVALTQAQAAVAKAKAAYDDAKANAERYASLSNNAVSGLSRDQSSAQSLEALAAWQQAQADAAVAQLNLSRSTVHATVNGIISNFSMRPGDYVTVGNAVAAVVDEDSLYVDGYFEETKLRGIALGDPARVTLLGGGPAISGHVESIAAGIADAERTASPNLLANVNPTFTWVRLAQRVPVRIALDNVPAGTRLIAGLTATVQIEPPTARVAGP
jgi:RND family efflux transporter MFP subunit